MTAEEAFALFNHEYDDDDGLLLRFRMSDDVETERLQRFLSALEAMSEHYEGKTHVEKSIAYRVMSFRDTLSASVGHWKVSRPEGMTTNMVTALMIAFGRVFASA